jgi:hypothetical protein
MIRPLVAALLLLSIPAMAAEKDLDLGFARPGMMQGQFRYAAWPPGMSIYCSDDPDKPGTLGRLLAMPNQMQGFGATRCALLSIDDKNVWSPAKRKIAGHPAQLTATFGPDAAGTRRLVQLFIEFPKDGFADMAKFLTARFGPAQEDGANLVRWRTTKQEAVLIHEDGDTGLLMMMDLQLQAAMDARMQAAAPAPRK